MKDVPVQIKGLVPTPTGCGVFLGNEGADKVIAIFVDHSVAAAITMFLHKIKKPRPLTHDLIASIFTGLSVKVEKIVVNDLKDETFYARLFLRQENELGRQYIEIDARPSDSIAIALQQGSPIFVAPEVWAKADDMTWALEQASADAENQDGEDEDA
jgi:bifunctional DNase/RNase